MDSTSARERALRQRDRRSVFAPHLREESLLGQGVRDRLVVARACRHATRVPPRLPGPLEPGNSLGRQQQSRPRRAHDRLGRLAAAPAGEGQGLLRDLSSQLVVVSPCVGIPGARQVGGTLRRILTRLRRANVGVAALAKLAHGEADVPQPLGEPAAVIPRNRVSEAFRDGERLPVVLGRRVVGVHVSRLLRGALVEQQRPVPLLAQCEVVGEGLVVLGQAIGVELLDGGADDPVQGLAPPLQDALVGHVVGERVLEHEGQLGMGDLLVDQLEGAKLAYHCTHGLARLDDPLQQTQCELAADHRRHLDRPLRLLLEPVDPRHQHALDAVGDRDLGQIACELDAALLDPEHALLQERPGDLLDEEGIPLGLLHDQLTKLRRQLRRLDDRAGHGRHLGRREGLERDPHVVAAVAEGLLVAGTMGEQKARPGGGDRIDQELEEFLGGGVDPVQVLDHEDQRLPLGRAQEERVQGSDGLAPARDGVEFLDLRVGDREREELVEEGERPAEIFAGATHGALHLGERRVVVVAIFDAEAASQPVDDRLEGGGAPERCAAPLEPGVRLVAEPAAKLVEESRFAKACLSDQEARLAAPLARGLEGGAQRRELLLAPHQRREARRGDGVDAPADGAVGNDAVHANGLGPALDLLLALVLELEEARDEPPDRLGDQDLPGIRERLEARGQVRGVAHGGVVHAQVVADATHDHRAGVDADPHLELDVVACL